VTAALLHRLLADAAAAHPQRPAVVDADRVVTYRELDAWSSRVARTLVDAGVRPGDRVGFLMDKSPEAVAAIYGILKAGACYVPCDPAAPAARTAVVAADCGMRVLCTDAAHAEAWARTAAPGLPIRSILILSGPVPGEDPTARLAVSGVSVIPPAAIAAQPDEDPSVSVSPGHLAYILYTSGSTGRPKGVMLSHANALAFVEWAVRELRITESDRLSSHAPFHFDLSILDLFAAAAGGAATCLVPRTAAVFPARLARFIHSAQITVWYSVPSALVMLVQRGGLRRGDLPGLRACLFAGEVFPTRYLRELMELLPRTRFGNLYGPTETNVCTAYWPRRPPEDDRDIPIGTPIAGVRTFLIPDPQAPEGARIGELCVEGPTVAHGYWGDDEGTARKFVAGADGLVAYRTGDLVEELADGHYRFIGRRDNQIKSRGYRIELEEIEGVLRRLAGVIEVAVVAVPDDAVTNLVKACAVVTPGLDRQDLRRQCLAVLPPHLVPDIFALADALPRTSTGKIDRAALAAEARGTLRQ
jgi:amino acid adenylation domain-containing protein